MEMEGIVKACGFRGVAAVAAVAERSIIHQCAAGLNSARPELIGSFNLIFYSSAEDAVFKALE